ncbi:hypothetical protein PCAR4_140140 [Paraburkholderia caribensis]|nr:hypothetical protein PCAR4_140140 [Paraburkholderia caribensis]
MTPAGRLFVEYVNSCKRQLFKNKAIPGVGMGLGYHPDQKGKRVGPSRRPPRKLKSRGT